MDVIQSVQTEIAHLLTVTMVLLKSKVDGKYILFIPIIFHIIRYYKNWDKMIKISNMKNMYMHVFNIIIILFHDRTNQTEILSIISGLINIYNVWMVYSNKEVNRNYIIDVFMIFVSMYLLKTGKNDKYVKFFSIRELVYHVLEWFIIY